jgi:putative phage-type endonuclease
LGLSPYRTAVEVWMEKTGKTAAKVDSLPLRFGSFAEDFVASEYARQTEASLLHYPRLLNHPKYNYLGGHIDRFVVKPGHGQFTAAQGNAADASLTVTRSNEKLAAIGPSPVLRLLECKTANPFRQHDWGEAGTDQIPLPYLCQCLWYLAITQIDQIDLAVLFGNSDFRIYKVYRDLSLENTLLEKAINFWQTYVLTDTPPPPGCEADYQALFARECSSKTVEAPASLFAEVQRITELQQHIDQFEEKLSSIKQHVMAAMQDAEVLTYSGKIIATWKTPKPTQRLDGKKLAEKHPDIAASFMTSSQGSRRLLIKPNMSA